MRAIRAKMGYYSLGIKYPADPVKHTPGHAILCQETCTVLQDPSPRSPATESPVSDPPSQIFFKR
jgi:hypothetical protein